MFLCLFLTPFWKSADLSNLSNSIIQKQTHHCLLLISLLCLERYFTCPMFVDTPHPAFHCSFYLQCFSWFAPCSSSHCLSPWACPPFLPIIHSPTCVFTPLLRSFPCFLMSSLIKRKLLNTACEGGPLPSGSSQLPSSPFLSPYTEYHLPYAIESLCFLSIHWAISSLSGYIVSS